ncbi:MAG: MCP four helix bundle domain-containing protein [Magnetococcales bacterium]|nr:MCP four helix bundle domain-containing protein [Magnetococcales bacterium]
MNQTALSFRLKTNFALVILLMLILGVISIFVMQNLSSLTVKLHKHPYTVSTAALRIDGNILKIQTAIEQVVKAKSVAEVQSFKQRIEMIEQQVHSDFSIIKERFLGDKQRVVSAQEAFKGWKPTWDEIIALMATGQQEKALTIVNTDRGAQADGLDAVMNEFIEFADGKANAFLNNAIEEEKQSVMIISILIGIAVLVGWWFARAATQSLGEIVSVISTSSAQIAATINQQERITAQQTSSINETNTTMEELGASARQSAEQSESAADNAQKALQLAENGVQWVEEMMESMKGTEERVEAIARQILSLSEQTSQISSITNTVTDFANETKMLAMNAAVEAVRAGEHGKGFSVLSVEIRKLADESKRSAERINGLVEQIQKATNTTVMVTEEGTKTVNKGMEIARNTSETFNQVTRSVNSASQSAQQISMNVRQQAVAVKQVVDAMQLLNTGSKENASGISQIKSGIQLLKETSQKLQSMI